MTQFYLAQVCTMKIFRFNPFSLRLLDTFFRKESIFAFLK